MHSTRTLLSRHHNGDRDAFTALYDRHAAPVRRSIKHRMGRKLTEQVEPEDLMQETFLAVWSWVEAGKVRFQSVGGFRQLLVKVAMRKIIDHARALASDKQRVARNSKPLSAVDEDRALVGNVMRPSQVARGHELEEIHDAVFAELDARDRVVLDMRDNLCLTYDEMATELNCTRSNGRLRYFRARQRFAAALRAAGVDEASGA